LLLDGDSFRFAQNLVHSGRARLHYLQTTDRQVESEGRFLCCANDKGFEALAAAGDLTGARRIASMQPKTMSPEAEYEEDHLFKRALYALVDERRNRGDDEAEELLSRLEHIESGTSELLAAVARTLLACDADGYAVALATLVGRRRERFAQLAGTPGFSREHSITERHVFVLGLAIERIAEVRGMQGLDLPCLPALARLSVMVGEPMGDAWLQASER
jgi:hypothetical protein